MTLRRGSCIPESVRDLDRSWKFWESEFARRFCSKIFEIFWIVLDRYSRCWNVGTGVVLFWPTEHTPRSCLPHRHTPKRDPVLLLPLPVLSQRTRHHEKITWTNPHIARWPSPLIHRQQHQQPQQQEEQEEDQQTVFFENPVENKTKIKFCSIFVRVKNKWWKSILKKLTSLHIFFFHIFILFGIQVPLFRIHTWLFSAVVTVVLSLNLVYKYKEDKI